MLKTRFLALVAAFVVGFAPILACAQVVTVPSVRGPGGAIIRVTPVLCVDQTGAYIGCGGAGGSTAVKATAAAPTYVEGSATNPLSSDLSGNLRITGSINASSTVKATAADPSYTEGSSTNPVSTDLAGYARSLAKQFGTWNVGLTGTLPAFAATPTFTIGAGSAIGGKFSVVDSGGGDATDTLNHAVKVSVVAGGSGGGSLSAKANAAAQTSTEGATTDPLSMDLFRELRIIPTYHGAEINLAAPGAILGADAATIASLTNPFPIEFADTRPSSAPITAADIATTTIAGMGAQTLVTGTPTTASFQVQPVNGQSSATITVPTSSFVATLNIEGSADNGTTYAPLKGIVRGSDLLTAQITQATVIGLDVTGLTQIRVRASAYTSGSPVVQMTFSPAPGMTKLTSAASIAAPISLTSRILSAAASTNATSAKTTAGTLYGVQGYNAATAVRYLKIYNKASSPTVGTDTPIKTIALPPSAAFAFDWPLGYAFSTGIAYALTTGSADADTGALTAADVVGFNLDYK